MENIKDKEEKILKNEELKLVGTIMKKSYKKSHIVRTSMHHDCFSPRMDNKYIVLQVMYAGMEDDIPMFLVEYIEDKDYNPENYVPAFAKCPEIKAEREKI